MLNISLDCNEFGRWTARVADREGAHHAEMLGALHNLFQVLLMTARSRSRHPKKYGEISNLRQRAEAIMTDGFVLRHEDDLRKFFSTVNRASL